MPPPAGPIVSQPESTAKRRATGASRTRAEARCVRSSRRGRSSQAASSSRLPHRGQEETWAPAAAVSTAAARRGLRRRGWSRAPAEHGDFALPGDPKRHAVTATSSRERADGGQDDGRRDSRRARLSSGQTARAGRTRGSCCGSLRTDTRDLRGTRAVAPVSRSVETITAAPCRSVEPALLLAHGAARRRRDSGAGPPSHLLAAATARRAR